MKGRDPNRLLTQLPPPAVMTGPRTRQLPGGTAVGVGDYGIEPPQLTVVPVITLLVSQLVGGPGNSIVETSLLSGGLAVTTPYTLMGATYLAKWTYRLSAYGEIDNRAAADTLTFRCRVGATALHTVVVTMPVAAQVNMPFRVDWLWRFDSDYLTNNQARSTVHLVENSTAANTGHDLEDHATVFDLTVDEVVDVTAQWNNANAANVVRCLTYTLERMGG